MSAPAAEHFPWTIAASPPVRSSRHLAESGDFVGRQGPARRRGRAGQGADELGGEAIQDRPVTETVPLLDAGTGPDQGLGPSRAAVAHDRAGFDDAATADVAAVDHRAWADHYLVANDQLVIGQQMQHSVLQDLNPGADADRTVGIPDDLHAGADERLIA